MSKARQNFQDLVKTAPALDALWNFIQNDYPKRAYEFHTSWTTCSLYATDEETLLDAAIAVLYETPEVDYLDELPSLIVSLIAARAKKFSEQTRAIKFLQDAMNDLVQCNVRECDTDLEYDDEPIAA